MFQKVFQKIFSGPKSGFSKEYEETLAFVEKYIERAELIGLCGLEIEMPKPSQGVLEVLLIYLNQKGYEANVVYSSPQDTIRLSISW